MSTFVDKAINPKTGKAQSAIFIDDFYGTHHYGVAFKKDESDVIFKEITVKIDLPKYNVCPIGQAKQPNDEDGINTNGT